ncbi:MAG: hypothetical protein CMJ58_19600 [Planctomycetaceae bacterium]|nr:hypothetical protein [Planctomycetaceae bacterium]
MRDMFSSADRRLRIRRGQRYLGVLCGLAFLSGAVAGSAVAAPRVITVDKSIQEAIDSIPADNAERVIVQIPNGVYTERIRLDQNRVTLRGESREGVRIEFNLPREEYHRRYDRFGVAVVNLFSDDCVLKNLTIVNTQPTGEHAFAVYGQPNRLIIDNCNVLGVGGDTLSLWNTAFGMYYHRNCRFKGRVDFVCPRGWCFVRDSQFEEVDTTAAIWHDGHLDPNMKFVLRDCQFDGVQDWWLGRNHYPSQFYLLDCQFSATMADRPIGVVKDISSLAPAEQALYERKYFHNCHRDGDNFPWYADNLSEAAGAPTPDEITPAWTFDGRWDPESTAAPTIESVETDGDRVIVQFSEPVAGAAGATVVRTDGSVAAYDTGSGTRRISFVGGQSDSAPQRFAPADPQAAYGALATLAARYVPEQDLPAATPLKKLTIVAVGDSTVADYDANSPLQGWGWGLRAFFDDRVTVVNEARNGRSSKSFRSEGHWRRAQQTDADYVLIQFGHNDNRGKGPERETDPAAGGDFRANLRRYVEEARAAGATAVLLTPPVRRIVDESGQLVDDDGNADYAEAARAVARELDCPLVDLAQLTRDLFNRLAPNAGAALQTEGDTTHFNHAGARRLAVLVLEDLQRQLPELRPFIVQERLTRP